MTLRDRVESVFRAHPNAWIDAHELARVGGFAAWRTRVSELRQAGMALENRWRTVELDGGRFRVSEYRWVCGEMPTLNHKCTQNPASGGQANETITVCCECDVDGRVRESEPGHPDAALGSAGDWDLT